MKHHQPGCLTGFPQYIALKSASRLDIGEAQIRATVTAKSCRGQVRKHYIWYGLTSNRARLNTQCSNRPEIGWESDEGGEKRESQISLTQLRGEHNAVVPCHSEPDLSARNLLAGGETADSSRDKAALRNDKCFMAMLREQNTLPSFARPGRVEDPPPHGPSRTQLLPITAGPAFRRKGRWIRFRDRNLGCETFRWGRADCRQVSRSPSSPTGSLERPGNR